VPEKHQQSFNHLTIKSFKLSNISNPSNPSNHKLMRTILYGLQFYLLNFFIAYFPSQGLRKSILKIYGMKMGINCAIYGKFEIRNPWRISIGNNTSIGHRATLDGRGEIRIGNHVNISSEVMIWTWQHDYNSESFETKSAPVTIQDYAWVSARTIVLPGVTIAEGCVIAAGAVLTKSTEPYSIYAGVPAKKIGERTKTLSYNPVEQIIPFI
jgi:acetyltransferase-like isoleucine patch superfamily enzyme